MPVLSKETYVKNPLMPDREHNCGRKRNAVNLRPDSPLRGVGTRPPLPFRLRPTLEGGS
jgi:hypothetical protein